MSFQANKQVNWSILSSFFFFCLVSFVVGCQKEIERPLAYHLVGQSDSKIVFLHGLLASSSYWDQMAPLLSSKHELLLLDLFGFGESPKPRIEYTVDQHIAKINEVVNLAIPKKAFTLVGHSMGALLALNFAIQHPQNVRKLILINAPMLSDEKDLKQSIAESSSKFMVTMTFDKTWGKLVCRIHELLPFISYPIIRLLEPELPPNVARAAGQHTWDSYSGSFRHVLLEQDFFKLLSKVETIPILIIASSNDEYTRAQVLLRLPVRQNIKFILLKGDHNMLLRQPEQVSQVIEKFLDESPL